jgi:hypothetical protein
MQSDTGIAGSMAKVKNFYPRQDELRDWQNGENTGRQTTYRNGK